MISKIIDSAFPIIGGVGAAATKVPEVQAAVETSSPGGFVIETILVAIIGATVGFIVKKILDIIWPKIFKHKK